jgi:hypothetical protein
VPTLEVYIVDSTEDALTALTMADTGRGVGRLLSAPPRDLAIR